jgi:hypothetical protein
VHRGSIFLDPNWMLTRYGGWRQLFRSDDSLFIQKGFFPLKRQVIISMHDVQTLIDAGIFANYFDRFSSRTVKLILPDVRSVELMNSLGFVEAVSGRRSFHKHTFIIDLSKPEGELFLSMRQTARNLCNRSERAGLSVSIESNPTISEVEYVVSEHDKIALQNGIDRLSSDSLRKMFVGGNLLLAKAMSGDEILCIGLIYLADNFAMYLHGVTIQREVHGAGHYLQWQVMRSLKDRGLLYYDLGGVPSIEATNGIFNFKKAFGGELVQLGQEFHCAPFWFDSARRVKRMLFN